MYMFIMYSKFKPTAECAVLRLTAQSCSTLCDPTVCSPPGSSVHGDSPGKNSIVGGHAFLQGIFPTQGSNPGLPDCRRILSPSEPSEKTKNTGVGSRPFSRGSSNPGIKLGSLALQVDSLAAELPGKPRTAGTFSAWVKEKEVFTPRDTQIHTFVAENFRNQLYGFEKGVLIGDPIQQLSFLRKLPDI